MFIGIPVKYPFLGLPVSINLYLSFIIPKFLVVFPRTTNNEKSIIGHKASSIKT